LARRLGAVSAEAGWMESHPAAVLVLAGWRW